MAAIHITKEGIQKVFAKRIDEQSDVKRYRKFKGVDARIADLGEKILTVIGGEVETTNTANEGDVVVMNITTKSREQHLLPGNIFSKRYTNSIGPKEEWTYFHPIGEIDAFEWDGVEVEFDAPWNEKMIMRPGDFLCRVPGSTTDIYRIERQTFFDTYR